MQWVRKCERVEALFFSSRRRHTRFDCDWSSDVCSSDLVRHRLNANLVTISACNGSGTRAYSGEGLVGLSWAFLRAGAHNVIGALWEVSDARSEERRVGKECRSRWSPYH